MESIQTGILSFGMSGRIFHAPFIEAHPGFSFRAVTERSEKKAAQTYPAVISYASVDELLADPEIELVIVNTPNYTHYDLARKALEAGKHVLVEKPAAATAEEVKTVFALGEAAGKKVMMYQNRRWDSDFQAIRAIIDSGVLGELVEVSFRFDRYRYKISSKSFKELAYPAAGLTYDLAPHLLDQLICLFGKPLRVHKQSGVHRPGSQVDDYFAYQLTFSGNIHAFAASSLLVADPLPSFVLHGTRGSFVKHRSDVQEPQLDLGMSPLDPTYGWEDEGAEGRLTVIGDDGLATTTLVASPKGNYMGLFDAVHDQLRNGVPYPIKPQEIIWQMELLETKPASL